MNLPVILRVFKDDHIVEVKQFQQDQIVIGNQPEVNLNLNDASVSPIHALIEKRNESYYICDLGSDKGTYKGANAILDEILESGDELFIGNFKVQFSVGAPKPKVAAPDAVVNSSGVQVPAKRPPPIPVYISNSENENVLVNNENKIPFATNDVETIASTLPNSAFSSESNISTANTPKIPSNKPEGIQTVERPNLNKGVSYSKSNIVGSGQSLPAKESLPKVTLSTRPKLSGTFAPPSAVTEENQVIKAGRGSVLEVSVAWKERIIETYHFKGNRSITIGSGEKVDIFLPGGVFSGTHTIVDFQAGVASVNLSSSMSGDLILEKSSYDIEHLRNKKRMNTNSRGQNVIRLEQGEAFKVALVPGLINVYIRYVPATQKPTLVPFLPFTTGEIASVLMAVALVGLIALYNLIHAPVEAPKEELQPEIISVTKFIYPTVRPPVEKSVPPPPLPPPVKVETPPKEKQKLVLGDETRLSQPKKVEKPQASSANLSKGGGGKPGSRAAEAAPNKNKNAAKKFTSVQQGGSIKIGEKAGANASQTQKPVDLSNVGLTSTFGGGGASSKLRQAVQGAGGIIGDANQATGAAGFSKNRPGDDLGSAFKDTGAGGKGVATEGISGGITNGRGSGNSGYGGVGTGLGNKAGVNVDVGGYGASFVGTIDRNGIIRVIQQNKAVIRRCYERELRFKKSLSGRLMVNFIIGEQGRVTSASIDKSQSTLNNEGVESCLANEIKTFKFPDPPAGSIAEIKYPFNFQNGE